MTAEARLRPELSPSDAAIEGFRLLGARWRAVLGWSLFNLVAVITLFIVLAVLLLAIIPFVGSKDAAQGLGADLAGLIVLGGGGLVSLMILCGLYRLELKPEDPGFIHLRIGRDELRVLGAALLVFAVAIPMIMVLAFVTDAVAKASPLGAAGVALAGGILVYAVLLRLGLTSVMAFAEGRISLPESWRRTRGQTWRLLGMALLRLCLVLLLGLLVAIAVFVVSGLIGGFRDFGLSGEEAFTAHPGRYLFQLAVQFLLAPLWLVIGQAPWIAVYRALKP